jgi:hypothetical protein
MIVGCYSLHLYCDGLPNCKNRNCRPGAGGDSVPPAEYSGQTRGECSAKARRQGWRLNPRTDTALCPACAKAGVRPSLDI